MEDHANGPVEVGGRTSGVELRGKILIAVVSMKVFLSKAITPPPLKMIFFVFFNGKKPRGEMGRVNADAQTGKESNLDNNYGVTGDQAGGFPSKEKTSTDLGKLWETINDKDFLAGRCQVLDKERGDKAQGSKRVSSYDNMGSEAGTWANPRGSFMGRRLVDVEKTMKEA